MQATPRMPSESRSATLLLLAAVFLAWTLESACAQPTTFVWNHTFGAPSASSSFGDPHLYCTKLHDGHGVSERWMVAVVVTDGSGANQSFITAMDEATGLVMWTATPSQTYPTPPYSGWCDSMPYSATPDDAATTTVLFCGLDDGVIALNGTDGAILWRFRSPDGPNAATPSHPTAVPSSGSNSDSPDANGFVVFTFENGVNSSVMYVLCAKTGMALYRTDGERVFTKIWRVAAMPSAIAFCSINTTDNIQVSVRQLSINTTRTIWSHVSLPYSPPGLWDNPNLDVDARGETVFMYEKEAIGLRTVKQFCSKTGALKWSITTHGHVADYDTYAYDNNFMRLVTNNTSGLLVVETYNTSLPQSQQGSLMWSSTIPCEDPNAILLVGGATPVPHGWVAPHVLVFGLNTGTLWNLDRLSGRLMWTMNGLVNISTGIVGHSSKTLMFGIGSTATFYSLTLQ